MFPIGGPPFFLVFSKRFCALNSSNRPLSVVIVIQIVSILLSFGPLFLNFLDPPPFPYVTTLHFVIQCHDRLSLLNQLSHFFLRCKFTAFRIQTLDISVSPISIFPGCSWSSYQSLIRINFKHYTIEVLGFLVLKKGELHVKTSSSFEKNFRHCSPSRRYKWFK